MVYGLHNMLSLQHLDTLLGKIFIIFIIIININLKLLLILFYSGQLNDKNIAWRSFEALE